MHLYMLGLLIDALAKQTMAFQMTEASRHEVIGWCKIKQVFYKTLSNF